MANNCINELRIIHHNKERVKEVREYMRGVDYSTKEPTELIIDFRKIVPRPATLNIESGSYTYRGQVFLDQILNDTKESDARKSLINDIGEKNAVRAIRLAIIADYNLEKHGYSTWYHWSYDKWGTKWNAYDQEELLDDFVRYYTANGHSSPVVKALSNVFPDVRFELSYADEDIGYHLGFEAYEEGEKVDWSDMESGSADAIAFACEMWGYDPSEFDN